MRLVDEDGEIVNQGRNTTARRVEEAQTSFPVAMQCPKSETDRPELLYTYAHRFIRKNNPERILIYTDGACLGNGQSNPQAGYSFVWRPSAYSDTGEVTHAGTVCGRLEEYGPTGVAYKQTSNRAELRAVIAALQFRDWGSDCRGKWTFIVIATDSEYVAIGATEWIRRWESEGWRTSNQRYRNSENVKNQDLWKLLLGETRKLQSQGIVVGFWRIPREWNERADEFAKVGAQHPERINFVMKKWAGPTSVINLPYTTI